MKFAGIDIGSRSIQFIILENEEIVDWRQADTGHDILSTIRELIDYTEYDRIMATGYGRNFMELSFDSPTVTEIKAYAAGVRYVIPEASHILDIGGQDSKVIELNTEGKVKKFEMNDRCAAGTGKFLEVMARNLGYSLDDFGPAALSAGKKIKINNMCAVFAESEVVGMLARGIPREEIALGLHHSVAGRAVSMLRRLGKAQNIVFAGGVAQNICMSTILQDLLQTPVTVPEDPQRIGALGAALLASEMK